MKHIPISFYKSFFSKDRNEWVPGGEPFETDFYTEMQNVQNGKHKDIIEQLRAIDGKKEKQAFKRQNLHSMSISSVCHTWREVDNVVNHSGLLNIDIDSDGNEHIQDWSELRDMLFDKLPDIVACFLSASRKGVTFVVKIDPIQHLNTFLSIVFDMQRIFGIKCDTIAKDVVRLRFVSYDPYIRIRYNIDELRTVYPTPEYNAAVKEPPPPKLHVATNGDSEENFLNAVHHVETKTVWKPAIAFSEGSKYHYLIGIAGYCNTYGMNEEYCCAQVVAKYGPLTTITQKQLLAPIKHIYKKYTTQFGTKDLDVPVPLIPDKIKAWLLERIAPDYLESKTKLYGLKTIGTESYTIHVDTELLVFLMHLACPQYTWTCIEPYDQHFSNEECKDVFVPGQFVDACNGNVLMIKDGYPALWDEPINGSVTANQ